MHGPGADESRPARAAVLEFEEAHVSTIHGFCAELLRERPVEARNRPVIRGAHRSGRASGSSTKRLRIVDGGRACRSRAKASGARCAARARRTWWRDDEEEEGPIARLRKAGRRAAAMARSSGAVEAARLGPTRDHRSASCESVLDVAEMTETRPSTTRDVLFQDTTLAAPNRPARSRAPRRQSPRDYDGLEALLATLAGETGPRSKKRKGSGAMYSRAVPRQTIVRKARGCAARSVLKNFRDVADADLAALVHAELQACVRRLRGAQAADRNARLPRPADSRPRSRARLRARPRATFSQRFTFILVDEFQDTDPLQAELLLLLAATRRTSRRMRRRDGRTPVASRRAVHRRRSEAVDLSLPPRRRRHVSAASATS